MATFATFKRLKDEGLAALKQGDCVATKPYLIQATECMIEIAEENKDPKQPAEQETYAKELMELELAAWNERDRWDVAALIGTNRLNLAFSRRLHPVVQGVGSESVSGAWPSRWERS